MGSFLDKPKTEKTNASGDGNNLHYGLASMQGWRIEMEDAHCAVISLPINGFGDWSFFAVFDGHAGAKVSQYCSENLLDKILTAESYFAEANNNSQCVNNNSTTNSSDNNNSSSPAGSPASKSSNSSSTANNTSLTNSQNITKNEKLKQAIVKGFLDLDDAIRKLPEFVNGEDKSGSTAIACLISPHNVYLINCGDSRGIVSRDNQVVLNTYDHKPVNPQERERIQRAGGSVMIQRVNGSLAVSRALGDFEYKMVDSMGPCEQLVSPEPEVYSIERNDKDEFLVLACDGIWDVMSNEDVKDFVRSRLKVTNNLIQISNEILDTCLYKGSRDNMSVVIVTFPGAPKPNPNDMDNEKNLNDKLEARIKEIISSHTTTTKPDLSYVLNTISHENWDYLPPGGGLASKQGLIAEIFNKLVPSV